MDAFSIISQYVLNSSKKYYFPTGGEITPNVKYEFWKFIFENVIHNSEDITERTVKILFYLYITKHDKYETRNKFIFLKESMENIFCNDETLIYFFNTFNKIQSVYHSLSRFAFLYKYKKSTIKVDKDMYLNNIVENQRNTITILQNGYKYLFTITDIINILNTCLGNTDYFFASPRVIKNPYNNMPLTKAMLYNIYYTIKASNFIMPILFHSFFLENFNIALYALNNESIIREYSIKKHIESGIQENLCKEIRGMLSTNKYGRRIYIDPDFPNDKLLEIMRPYLYLFYLGNYSVDFSKRIIKQDELNRRLHKFVNYNCLFGRKNVKVNACLFTGKKSMITTFNDKFLPFGKTDKKFFNDHVVNSFYHYNEEEERNENRQVIDTEESVDDEESDED
jgi:hypothetical protein